MSTGRTPESDTVRIKSWPLIDNDPHFKRVVGYFRPVDYLVWASCTAGIPLSLIAYERHDPSGTFTSGPMAGSPNGRPLRIPAMRGQLVTGGIIGLCCGFLMAYSRSCRRFVGWSENRREYERDHAELSALARQEKPLYGASSQPEGAQRGSHYNSQWAFTKSHAIPWFNFVNHPWHGRSKEDYLQPCDYDKADGVSKD